MSKEYFQVSSVTSLRSVPSGGKIHIIGVSGVAMAQLACALAKKGYAVSGSDTDFWEPMGSLLRSSTVALCGGYREENIPEGVDLVVIGNAIRYGNPEVDAVERSGIPYSLFPRILAETAIEGRHSIVVSGTHGKTTTTALCAFVLQCGSAGPSWFFGGAAPQFSESLSVGSGPFSVVEGDEYDSAFFAKVPKFSFYMPDTLVVTSIEFDHADIYPDVDSIKSEFSRLVLGMPPHGRVILCDENPSMRDLAAEWKRQWHGSVFTYGTSTSDFALSRDRQEESRQICTVTSPEGSRYTFSTVLPGLHNAQNVTAVFAACRLAGLDSVSILEGIARFEGVRRRQELLPVPGNVILIEDFAHHPTAVLRTLEGIRERFPGRRLWGVFEPRSNTSRRRLFQSEYVNALSVADCIVLSSVVPRHNDAGIELLDVQEMCVSLKRIGRSAVHLPDYDSVRDHVVTNAQAGDVIVMMSNGSFGGIIPRVADGIGKRTRE